MSKLTVGIVDYGVGNLASLRQALFEIGFRCRISDQPSVLDACHVLVLPGVGAFRPAIEALRSRGLDQYLIAQAAEGRPLLGICLGMQLLADESLEHGSERGLGIIPGAIVPFGAPHWHIGWNTIEHTTSDPLFAESDGDAFFFTHSFVYEGPAAYRVAQTKFERVFSSVIRRDRVVGVQFHPEKSQQAGRALLQRLIPGLCRD